MLALAWRVEITRHGDLGEKTGAAGGCNLIRAAAVKLTDLEMRLMRLRYWSSAPCFKRTSRSAESVLATCCLDEGPSSCRCYREVVVVH